MRERERTKLVVDDTTVYEIDLECTPCSYYVGKRDDEEQQSKKEHNTQ